MAYIPIGKVDANMLFERNTVLLNATPFTYKLFTNRRVRSYSYKEILSA